MLYFWFLILIIQVCTPSTELLRIHDKLVALSIDFSYHLILHLWTISLWGAWPIPSWVLSTWCNNNCTRSLTTIWFVALIARYFQTLPIWAHQVSVFLLPTDHAIRVLIYVHFGCRRCVHAAALCAFRSRSSSSGIFNVSIVTLVTDLVFIIPTTNMKVL